ncbi:MAG: hypothetical protein KTR15_15960 [Phycisphaeraceae bacterium]|nr:hypothetical protein [Phycisphaeraceae bacterium]
MKLRPAFATLSLIAAVSMPAFAQSRNERVNQIASALSAGISDDPSSDTVYTDARTGEVIRATPVQLMRETMTSVDFKDIPGKMALEIWSNQTNVPLVVSWKSLEAQGVDPNTPITLTLGRVPAEQVLKLIVQQLHPDPIGNDELLLDVQQWYVRIMTKEDALRRSTTKLYFIGDLLMDIPNFDNAPRFDLNEALSNTSSGGSNGGGREGGGLFPEADDREEEVRLTKQEKAERIADMVRNTIEPDIWRSNGGEYGSVRYYRGMLVVKAPEFVHQQIGGMTGASVNKSSSKRKTTTTSRRSSADQKKASRQGSRSSSGNVAGVAPDAPKIPR